MRVVAVVLEEVPRRRKGRSIDGHLYVMSRHEVANRRTTAADE